MRGACIDPPGYDAGKKIKGKKRHVLVDTQGLLMHAIVHSADVVQDHDGGALLMASRAFPFLVRLYADGGYQGPEFQSGFDPVRTGGFVGLNVAPEPARDALTCQFRQFRVDEK